MKERISLVPMGSRMKNHNNKKFKAKCCFCIAEMTHPIRTCLESNMLQHLYARHRKEMVTLQVPITVECFPIPITIEKTP